MLTYALTSLLLTFWILPGLVTVSRPSGTGIWWARLGTRWLPHSPPEHLRVLPVLAERSKELLRKASKVPPEFDSNVDVIISTSFSFPNVGKILTLGFRPLAGWFSDSAVPVSKYPTFAVSGFFSFFGDPTVAIPFLLDLLRIPSDTFHFFLAADNLVGARFGTLLAAMYTLVLAVLGAGAVSGMLRIRWRALLLHTGLTFAFMLCVIGGVRVFFQYAVGQEYKKDQDFMAMELSREYPQASVLKSSEPPIAHDRASPE